MAGVVLETVSNKKLIAFGVGLAVVQLVFILLGGLVAPSPSNVQNVLATKCLDINHHIHTSDWFWSRSETIKPCDSVSDFDDPRLIQEHIDASHIVFTFQIPLPKEGQVLDMSRWFQNIVATLMVDIDYHEDWLYHDKPEVFLDARLGYSNKGEGEGNWTEITRSHEKRALDCDFSTDPKTDDPLHCDMLSLFELGSCHHDYYLINIRVPVDEMRDLNMHIPGKIKDMWLVVITQNGGFTKVWVSIKTFVFPILAATLAWFCWRVFHLNRKPNLLERTLIALGLALTLLNIPIEWFSLVIHMPYMLLYSDIKQGLFYSVLLSFWIIFAGEHMMDSIDRSSLVSYWKHLVAVAFGCICLFVFEMCERGVQLSNPFYSIWATEAGSNMALAFIVLAGLAAGCYFLFLCYMIFKVFRNIGAKKASLPSMNKNRQKFYIGLIYRFKFLMVVTIICIAMTVSFFMVGQISEGQWKWDDEINVEYTSAFLTGVYGMWNLYVFSLLILYAPSYKYIQASVSEDETNEDDENIEFTSLPTEVSALQTFVQKAAAD